MTTPNLAKIERVDLSEVWANEAQHFTPWLAENIDELGETLRMQLEWQETEAAVGRFSLDIRAIATSPDREDRSVVIENQFGMTNHDHLGKLLTYAAGFNANVAVWLTGDFRDEHKQALDWLNEHTDEKTEFFGVFIELLRIGDSLPAPLFNLFATPKNWERQPDRKKSGEASSAPSERAERYGNFFQPLVDTLRQKHNFTNARKAGPNHWVSFSTGHRQIKWGANFTRPQLARVEVYIDREASWNANLLENLKQRKDEIENKLGQTLDWQPLENRRACRIALTRSGSIDANPNELSEIGQWMIDNLLKFKDVFSPHLTELVGQNPPQIEEQPTSE